MWLLLLRLRESNSPGDYCVRSALEFRETSVDHKFGSTLGVRSLIEILYEVRNKVSNWGIGHVSKLSYPAFEAYV